MPPIASPSCGGGSIVRDDESLRGAVVVARIGKLDRNCAPPECHRVVVARDLMHLPRAGEKLERLAGGRRTDATAPISRQYEELRDRMRLAFSHQNHAGYPVIHSDQERVPDRLGPVPIQVRVAEPAMGIEIGIIEESGELVGVEFQQLRDDVLIFKPGGAEVNVHQISIISNRSRACTVGSSAATHPARPPPSLLKIARLDISDWHVRYEMMLSRGNKPTKHLDCGPRSAERAAQYLANMRAESTGGLTCQVNRPISSLALRTLRLPKSSTVRCSAGRCPTSPVVRR